MLFVTFTLVLNFFFVSKVKVQANVIVIVVSFMSIQITFLFQGRLSQENNVFKSIDLSKNEGIATHFDSVKISLLFCLFIGFLWVD